MINMTYMFLNSGTAPLEQVGIKGLAQEPSDSHVRDGIQTHALQEPEASSLITNTQQLFSTLRKNLPAWPVYLLQTCEMLLPYPDLCPTPDLCSPSYWRRSGGYVERSNKMTSSEAPLATEGWVPIMTLHWYILPISKHYHVHCCKDFLNWKYKKIINFLRTRKFFSVLKMYKIFKFL